MKMKGETGFQSTYVNLLRFNFILYLFALSGFLIIPTKNLDTLNLFLKTIVSIFLIIRFNPYRKVKFTELDRRIVFSAAVFLFSTTTISIFIKQYMKNKIKNIKTDILDFNFSHVFL